MLKCRKCGGQRDPSDLLNGVCEDCREEDEQREVSEIRADLLYMRKKEREKVC